MFGFPELAKLCWGLHNLAVGSDAHVPAIQEEQLKLGFWKATMERGGEP